MHIETLGWSPELQTTFEPYHKSGFAPGRVALEHKHIYRVLTRHGEVLAEVSGKLRHQAASRADYPAVGDWVALSLRLDEGKATIHAVLPRFSVFSRRAAGPVAEQQIAAANVNTVFLVSALNHDFNLRRIERYLLLARESGAEPVIVLSKADLSEDVEEAVETVRAIAFGVPVHAVSSLSLEGMEALSPYLKEGRTIALLGSSGAGKSTLINRLYGSDIQLTGEIREGDDRGKHTTTYRELLVLPSGGILIDTPGMRELQLWEGADELDPTFRDIAALSESCAYKDCRHDKEPGCAVREALELGTLEAKRFGSYLKLKRELAYAERKENKAQATAHSGKSNRKKHRMPLRNVTDWE